MPDANSHDDRYETILREHTNLRCLLDELRKLLFERGEAFSEVSKRLVRLQEMVGHHFRTEEDSGCFGDLVNHAPRVSDRVEALIAEHDDLSVYIGQIVTRSSDCQGTVDDWEVVNSQFREFTARLMKHEAVENELLQQVFTEDIGSKD